MATPNDFLNNHMYPVRARRVRFYGPVARVKSCTVGNRYPQAFRPIVRISAKSVPAEVQPGSVQQL